jgi:hypothetical protein
VISIVRYTKLTLHSKSPKKLAKGGLLEDLACRNAKPIWHFDSPSADEMCSAGTIYASKHISSPRTLIGQEIKTARRVAFPGGCSIEVWWVALDAIGQPPGKARRIAVIGTSRVRFAALLRAALLTLLLVDCAKRVPAH